MTVVWQVMRAVSLLIATLYADLVEITLRSLRVILSALFNAPMITPTFGAWVAIRRFRFRRTAFAVLKAFMGLPPQATRELWAKYHYLLISMNVLM